MRAEKVLKYFFFHILVVLIKTGADVGAAISFVPEQRYGSDFNFHNKTAFLKDHIKKLIDCIEPKPEDVLPENETLFKSSKGSKSGTKRFVFEYVGSREYNESCFGDTYKRDFIRRLYDAVCLTYEEKVKFLDLLSCNATQNLECRQVGVEPHRLFAEQATPIMRCLCPDYQKSQSYQLDTTRGYFDKSRKQCVLKHGQICTINTKTLDKRLEWIDHDYDQIDDDIVDGIGVADLRPIASTYPCVNNAFCYTNDNKDLEISDYIRERCVCEGGYFSGTDRECHPGRDNPSPKGLMLALIMYSIGLLTFIAVLLI